MINFLVSGTLVVSLVGGLLLALHRFGLRWFGPHNVYSLWALIPFSITLVIAAPLLERALSALPATTQMEILQFKAVQSTLDWSVSEHALPAWLFTAFITFWSIGTLAMLGLFVRGLYRLRRYSTAERTSPRQYNDITVLQSSDSATPGIFGLIKPTLYLPTDFTERFNPSERHLILQHEFTHWRRGDTRMNALAWLVLSVQWFNPITWLSYQRFRADQELACDADVIARQPAGSRCVVVKDYANALLKTSISQPMSMHGEWGYAHLRHPSPCSTHYGYQQGSYTMLKERVQILPKPSTRKLMPLAVCGCVTLLMALVWQAPALSQTTDSTEADLQDTAIPLVRISPRYPLNAVEKEIEGYVDLTFTVNSEGKTDDIKVVASEPEGVFDEEVVKAVERWRYNPKDQGKELTLRMEMKLN